MIEKARGSCGNVRPLFQPMAMDVIQVPRLRLGLLLWAAGMLGVVAVTVTLLPEVLAGVPLPMPLWALSLLSVAQSAVFVALAVWAGVALAPAVGLHAPAFGAVITQRPNAPGLRLQLVWGLIAGLLSGVFLYTAWRYAPPALAEASERLSFPLVARVLYGGITEELLLRWGLMTALVWLAWRFLQRRRGVPEAGYVWLAIAVSALLFGAGHLPVAVALVGALNASAVVWVVGVNTAFGVLFGYLFWRSGLESAMIAHAVTHVVNDLADLL